MTAVYVFLGALVVIGIVIAGVISHYARVRKIAYNEYMLNRRYRVKLGDMDVE